jgi:MFS family permease
MMCVGAFLNSTLKPGVSIFTLGIIRVIGMIPMGGWYVNYRAWTRDKFPKERRAQFAGITLLFVVTLPMIIGSQIGSFVVSTFGIPTVVNGNSGFIPTPILYVVSAAISSLSLIPMLLVKEEKKGPELKETVETQA